MKGLSMKPALSQFNFRSHLLTLAIKQMETKDDTATSSRCEQWRWLGHASSYVKRDGVILWGDGRTSRRSCGFFAELQPKAAYNTRYSSFTLYL